MRKRKERGATRGRHAATVESEFKMLRRQAIAFLVGAVAKSESRARGSLARYLNPANGAAVLVDVPTRRVIAVNSESVAGTFLAPPGSTVKPLVLSALLRRGKLGPLTSFPCPARLTIGGRRFDCTHPRLAAPMRVDTALAYSCNCFVAHFAEQFQPGQLAMEIQNAGLARVRPALTSDAQRIQALGEGSVLTSARELALAYRQLAASSSQPEMQPIMAGLEGAMEFGTARNAHVAGVAVAGKTGSATTAAGAHVAWFAGYMPSRAPEVVVTVMLAGRSGGADAAPIAREILEAHRAGRI
jgi:membrane peptidoglycan carboxypeptidase